ncbi:hypothetical protein IJ472_06720 [bacterium]|nr:hypothetical protein [bacterium]
MSRPKRDLVRINTNINSNVLYYLDQFAADNGITRTTAITLLLAQKLTSMGYGVDDDKK